MNYKTKLLLPLIIAFLIITVNGNAFVSNSFVILSSGNIRYNLQKFMPEPGTPYKWLCARTAPFGWDFQVSDTNFMKCVNAIHPSVWQCQFPGDWWDAPTQYPYWKSYYLPSMINLTKYCHNNGIYSMILWGNMMRTDLDLGEEFLRHVNWFYGNLSSRGIAPPTWFGLDTEWIRFSNNSVSYVRPQLEALKAKVEGYGSRFLIAYTVDYSPWAIAYVNDYPMWWSTNYPFCDSNGNPVDPVNWINRLDRYQYGFGMKIGILRNDAYPYWTAQNIRTIFDFCDNTTKMGVIGLDIVTNMLDTNICPDFVPTVNAEASIRGYITNLNIPTK